MRIALTSVLVEDQQKARDFYVETLGWRVKHDIDMGGPRWLTLTSPEGHDDVELLLEPMGFDEARDWQQVLKARGVPAAAFASSDIDAEVDRLIARGVAFAGPVRSVGPTRIAMFDDTCGNLIQLFER